MADNTAMDDDTGQSARSNPSSNSQVLASANSFRSLLAQYRPSFNRKTDEISTYGKTEHSLGDIKEHRRDRDEMEATVKGIVDTATSRKSITELLVNTLQDLETVARLIKEMPVNPELQAQAQEAFTSLIEMVRGLLESPNGQSIHDIFKALQQPLTPAGQKPTAATGTSQQTATLAAQPTTAPAVPSSHASASSEEQVDSGAPSSHGVESEPSYFDEAEVYHYPRLSTKSPKNAPKVVKVATSDTYYLPEDMTFIRLHLKIMNLGRQTEHGWPIGQIVTSAMNFCKKYALVMFDNEQRHKDKMQEVKDKLKDYKDRAVNAEDKVFTLEQKVEDLETENARSEERYNGALRLFRDANRFLNQTSAEFRLAKEEWEKEKDQLLERSDKLRLGQVKEITKLNDTTSQWHGAALLLRTSNFDIQTPADLCRRILDFQGGYDEQKKRTAKAFRETNKLYAVLNAMQINHTEQHKRMTALFRGMANNANALQDDLDNQARETKRYHDLAVFLRSANIRHRANVSRMEASRDYARSERNRLYDKIIIERKTRGNDQTQYRRDVSQLQDQLQTEKDNLQVARDALVQAQRNENQTATELQQEKATVLRLQQDLQRAQANATLARTRTEQAARDAQQRLQNQIDQLYQQALTHSDRLARAQRDERNARNQLGVANGQIASLNSTVSILTANHQNAIAASNNALTTANNTTRVFQFKFIWALICLFDLRHQRAVLSGEKALVRLYVRSLRRKLAATNLVLHNVRVQHGIDLATLARANANITRLQQTNNATAYLRRDAIDNRDENRILVGKLNRAITIGKELEQAKDDAVGQVELLRELIRLRDARASDERQEFLDNRALIPKLGQELFVARTRISSMENEHSIALGHLKSSWYNLGRDLAFYDRTEISNHPNSDLSMLRISPILDHSELHSIVKSVTRASNLRTFVVDRFVHHFVSNDHGHDSGKLSIPAQWTVLDVIKEYYMNTNHGGNLEESGDIFKQLILVQNAIHAELNDNSVGNSPARPALLYSILARIGTSPGPLAFSVVISLTAALFYKYRPELKPDWLSLLDQMIFQKRNFSDMSILEKTCTAYLTSKFLTWPDTTNRVNNEFHQLATTTLSILDLLEKARAFYEKGEEVFTHEGGNAKWFFINGIQDHRETSVELNKGPVSRLESQIVIHLDKGNNTLTGMVGEPVVEKGLGPMNLTWGTHELRIDLNHMAVSRAKVVAHYRYLSRPASIQPSTFDAATALAFSESTLRLFDDLV
ncbi:hypothetical protein C1H76_3333 [Elsinoe australis]|uniref:Uncharacterized protein n=1 Tax=Elsinoe australis TaxID=40998 RepID=A0A4U7B9K4_9PEZI|nr:hypothetical protein C1H76_3333 [Elsinoe australis]